MKISCLRAVRLPVLLGVSLTAIMEGRAEAGAAFSVVIDAPVRAVVVAPAAEDVSALYVGKSPEQVNRRVSEWKPSAAGLLVSDVHSEDRGWYRIVYEDGRELVLGPRHVPEIRGRNFRDLGGYTTSDGARVKPGQLFRSGYLTDLSSAQKMSLQDLGIARVCDFRSAAERLDKPDPDLPGWQQIDGCQGGNSADSFAALSKLAERARAGEAVDWRGLIISSYAKMGQHYAPAFRALFDSLVENPQEPVLFHCTAGKDRTGIAAALVLLALGVTEEQVVADYTMSEMDPVSGLETDAYPEELVNQRDLQATDSEYIRSALEGIKQDYGSIAIYLRDVMGLTDERMEVLRSALLTAPE